MQQIFLVPKFWNPFIHITIPIGTISPKHVLSTKISISNVSIPCRKTKPRLQQKIARVKCRPPAQSLLISLRRPPAPRAPWEKVLNQVRPFRKNLILFVTPVGLLTKQRTRNLQLYHGGGAGITNDCRGVDNGESRDTYVTLNFITPYIKYEDHHPFLFQKVWCDICM